MNKTRYIFPVQTRNGSKTNEYIDLTELILGFRDNLRDIAKHFKKLIKENK